MIRTPEAACDWRFPLEDYSPGTLNNCAFGARRIPFAGFLREKLTE